MSDDDEILRIIQRPTADEMTARFAPLCAEADAAIRTDPEYVIELAKMASAVARGEPLPPLRRSPHGFVVADERAERRREADRRRWHARKAERSAAADESQGA
ncbi:hypothetical protein ACFV3I_18220 [Microbacterium sp. NPDC059771]|uniref:hypothetical protein n=1 Tax=Microbacterium sp. NPDC059771 TaxID=3346941 RepID=UPI003663684A